MSVFLGVHKLLPGMSIDEISNSYNSYKKAAAESGVKPLGAVVSMEKGFAYCQTEAESEEQVRQAHAKANVPLEDVIMVTPLV